MSSTNPHKLIHKFKQKIMDQRNLNIHEYIEQVFGSSSDEEETPADMDYYDSDDDIATAAAEEEEEDDDDARGSEHVTIADLRRAVVTTLSPHLHLRLSPRLCL